MTGWGDVILPIVPLVAQHQYDHMNLPFDVQLLTDILGLSGEQEQRGGISSSR